MQKFTYKDLFGCPKIPCLQGPKELKSYYAITLNPLEHKRITLRVPGKKSLCKKYQNYRPEEQEALLLQLMEPFEMIEHKQFYYERTQNHNLHIHTIFILDKEDVLLIAPHIEHINKVCADKAQTYVPFDIKILNNSQEIEAWKLYIKKNQ